MGLNESDESAAQCAIRKDLAVVQGKDGRLIKGVLHWHAAVGDVVSLPKLPDVLHIQHEAEGNTSTINLADARAVFFVKTLDKNAEYEEVKFFSDGMASDLWAQVFLADGEVLEGRTENRIALLVEPGFWLRPADSIANNLMVYVPKSSVVEFHVMGLAISQK